MYICTLRLYLPLYNEQKISYLKKLSLPFSAAISHVLLTPPTFIVPYLFGEYCYSATFDFNNKDSDSIPRNAYVACETYTGKCATCVFFKRMVNVRLTHGKRENRVTHV